MIRIRLSLCCCGVVLAEIKDDRGADSRKKREATDLRSPLALQRSCFGVSDLRTHCED